MAFTAEQKREYRARRRTEGNTVPSGARGYRRVKSVSGGFAAFDSEGATIDGKHRTTLWACAWPKPPPKGVVRASSDPGEYEYRHIANPNGLSWTECVEWLLSMAKSMRLNTPVLFGGSYDMNMLLNHLSYEKAQFLHANGHVLDEEYHWRVIPRRMITISKLRDRIHPYKALFNRDGSPKINEKTGKQQYKLEFSQTITLYDVIGFFQSNFLGAIKGFLGEDYPDYERIRAGKAKRNEFASESMEDILAYTQAELRALVQIMDRVRQGFRECDITIRQWIGAGAAGLAVLNKHHVREHIQIRKGKEWVVPLAREPGPLRDAIYHGYFGGRIEAIKFGYHRPSHGTIYNYDINSAYPYAMLEMPSLAGGRWLHRAGSHAIYDLPNFAIFHVKWRSPTRIADHLPFGPFPYREGLRPKGAVYFPERGEGWYWRPEVEAAIQGESISGVTIEIIEGYGLEPATDEKPFAFLAEYYTRRQAIVAETKRSGVPNMTEKALKLALNSCYGKTAQTIGGSEYRPPKHHALEWAGWTTSHTRAQLYTAALMAPSHIIAMATDGIWSHAPLDLPMTPGDKRLGEWEGKELDELLIIQPGFYWYGRQKKRGIHCRGVTRVSEDSPDHGAWLDSTMEQAIEAMRSGAESVSFPSRRFLTMGAALASRDRFTRWCEWIDDDREIALFSGGKRMRIPGQTASGANGMYSTRPTVPFSVKLGELSATYDPKWSRELNAGADLLDAMMEE